MKQMSKDEARREATRWYLHAIVYDMPITKCEPAKARNDAKLGKVTLGYPEKALSDTYVKPKRRA